MLNRYNLDINTDWTNLPWQKIYNKVIIIQKKIHKVTKKYHIHDKIKLQKYLINSIEGKIFSIENIINELCLYYNDRTTPYKLTSKDKFYILQLLFNKTINNKYILFIKMIQKYLLFLSIDSEWKAKLPILKYKYLKKSLISKINDKTRVNKWKNFMSIIIFNSMIYIKNLRIYKKEPSYFINHFIELLYLYKIILLNLDWYNLYLSIFQIKNKIFLYQLKQKIYSSYNMQLINIFKLHTNNKYTLIYIKLFINNYIMVNNISIKNIQTIYDYINKISYYFLKNKNNKNMNKLKLINFNIHLNHSIYIKRKEYFYIKY